MSPRMSVPDPQSTIQVGRDDSRIRMRVYDQLASAHSKAAIFTWCLVGWIYAAFTWHVLLPPGILIFFPGIFIASLIAAVFFIPLWFITKKVKGDLETYGGKHWQLLTLATILKIGGFISPIAGAIGYVQLLRYFLE